MVHKNIHFFPIPMWATGMPARLGSSSLVILKFLDPFTQEGM